MNDSEQKKVFQRNLTKLLNNTGKTQKEVADSIGVSAQTFNTWMRGIAIPRMGKIQALADYFGVMKTELIDPYMPSDVPTGAEMELIGKYRTLNEEGQEKVDEYVDDLCMSGKYKKSDPDTMAEKETA